MSNPAKDTIAEPKISKLKADFDKKLPGYIEKVQGVWSQISLVDWNERLAESLRYYCHRLAGSSSTYGHDELADTLRDIEKLIDELIDSSNSISDKAYQTIDDKIKKLVIKEANIHKSLELDSVEPSDDNPLTIFIIDDDSDTGLFVQAAVNQLGHKGLFFSSIKEALASLKAAKPSLILLDINFPEGNLAGIKAIARIRNILDFRVPIVMMSTRKDIKIRLQASTSGSDGFLAKPINVHQLSETIAKNIVPSRFYNKRILIVDDDRSTGLFYRALLKKEGIESHIVTDPLKTIQAINDFRPHLILMDNIMPNCLGTELAEIIRQDPSLFHIPIIFITADNDFSLPSKIFSLGAKGYLVKPINKEEFFHTIEENILNQDRLKKQFKTNPYLSNRSVYTNQSQFFTDIETKISGAIRSVFGMMLIEIQNFTELRAKVGLSKASLITDKVVEELDKLNLSGTIACKTSESCAMVFFEDETADAIEEKSSQLLASEIKAIGENAEFFDDAKLTYSLVLSQNKDLSIDSMLAKCEALAVKARPNKLSLLNLSNSDSQPDLPKEFDVNLSQLIEKKAYTIAYQPIISIEDSNDFFIDTYVRLIDESNNAYTPKEFFGSLSNRENYINLDRFVFENSTKNLLAINNTSRKDVYFIIRLTSHSILNKDTILWMSNQLQNSRMKSEKTLVLSIPESDLIQHTEKYSYFAEKVRMLGCRISLQGYGETNKSRELRDLIKPDFIKFDSIVLKQSTSFKSILSDLVQYSHQHGSTIIATKIESPQLLSEMYQMGVTHFQGYFIEEPSPNIDLDKKIELL